MTNNHILNLTINLPMPMFISKLISCCNFLFFCDRLLGHHFHTMAEPSLQEMVQDIITCSICVEEACDPRPLTCQHTFCLQCLKKYIESKERQDEIECPVCRKVCPLSNGNVDDLPASFLYSQLKDANTRCTNGNRKGTSAANKTDSEEAKQEQEFKTDAEECASQEEVRPDQESKTKLMCSSDDCEQIANVFCKTCKYICSECEADHKTVRAMKSHVILTLNEAANIQKNDLPLCSKHHDKQLELFCEDCDIPICYICYPVDHATHTCVELKIKATRKKDQMGQTMKTIKDHLNKTSEMSESITLQYAKLHETADNVKSQVRKRADEIIREVKYREEAIIQDVEENYKQADKTLKSKADKVNLIQGILQNLQYSSNQLYLHGSQYELVTKGKSIEQTVQDNNPDDVKLNLPELDTTEAELKLQDMKVGVMIYTI